MKKLRLEDLEVVSFSTGSDDTASTRGTVRGHVEEEPTDYVTCYAGCFSGESCNTCAYPCGGAGGGGTTGPYPGTQGLETCNWGQWSCNAYCTDVSYLLTKLSQ